MGKSCTLPYHMLGVSEKGALTCSSAVVDWQKIWTLFYEVSAQRGEFLVGLFFMYNFKQKDLSIMIKIIL